MSAMTMTARVEEYVAYRRALGYQIRSEAQMLQSAGCARSHTRP